MQARSTCHYVNRHTCEEKAFFEIKALTLALARSPPRRPARSLGPLPEAGDPRCPGRPKNQQRKSRAKKINGIRQALLPVTYILPSATQRQAATAGLRGTPARRLAPLRRRGETAARRLLNSAPELCPSPGGRRVRPARRLPPWGSPAPT